LLARREPFRRGWVPEARPALFERIPRSRSSGGRPEQLYGLTSAGSELFPRHYSWFAELLLDSLRSEKDSHALRERLEGMGRTVARQIEGRVAGLQDISERIRVLAAIMRELGYESGAVDSPKEKFPAIEATNCVFHSLAQRFPEVCHFDLAMMSKVVGRDAIHDECMVRGGHVCRFKFNRVSQIKRDSEKPLP
jgi:predicted ArsR family transcriptional regulator